MHVTVSGTHGPVSTASGEQLHPQWEHVAAETIPRTARHCRLPPAPELGSSWPPGPQRRTSGHFPAPGHIPGKETQAPDGLCGPSVGIGTELCPVPRLPEEGLGPAAPCGVLAGVRAQHTHLPPGDLGSLTVTQASGTHVCTRALKSHDSGTYHDVGQPQPARWVRLGRQQPCQPSGPAAQGAWAGPAPQLPAPLRDGALPSG